MKIQFLFSFKPGPYGGGNQFLKALKKSFAQQNIYTDNNKKADVILFNSNRGNLQKEIGSIIRHKRNNKTLINRIDGPISLKVRKDKFYDKLIWEINSLFMDGAIFQTDWSYQKMKTFRKSPTEIKHIVIPNAADPDVFYPEKKSKAENQSKKTKLVATSWASNYYIKGFDIYEYLDENLDFEKYEMNFIGNTPLKFKNIKHCPPVNSEQLAETLRTKDIFITASINDPCSNSLIEATQSGLPCVVRNSGGHPELIKNGGLTFNDKNDVCKQIDKVASNPEQYTRELPDFSLEDTAAQYRRFIEDVHNRKTEKKRGLSWIVKAYGLLITVMIYTLIRNVLKKL